MLKTRSSDQKQEKADMKGTKPHSIVKTTTATATAAAATKSVALKKNQKRTVEIVTPKSAVLRQRVEVGGSASGKPNRIESTVVDETPKKMKKSLAKNIELMEAKKAKTPKNAPTIKVEMDSEVNYFPLE